MSHLVYGFQKKIPLCVWKFFDFFFGPLTSIFNPRFIWNSNVSFYKIYFPFQNIVTDIIDSWGPREEVVWSWRQWHDERLII
jgi:hypothetical protein